MKQKNISQNQNAKSNSAPRLIMGAESNGASNEFIPSPDEVARKAYFTYVNEGSPEGRAVQHWLDAEAALTEERNLTRVHAFHNHT
jgi:hypothetical protein